MAPDRSSGKNLREYMQQTRTRLLLGFFVLIFLIGDGLVYVLYGREPFFMALLCTGLALMPVVFVALWLWIMEILTKRLRDG